jgi:hypothetical protein
MGLVYGLGVNELLLAGLLLLAFNGGLRYPLGLSLKISFSRVPSDEPQRSSGFGVSALMISVGLYCLVSRMFIILVFGMEFVGIPVCCCCWGEGASLYCVLLWVSKINLLSSLSSSSFQLFGAFWPGWLLNLPRSRDCKLLLCDMGNG